MKLRQKCVIVLSIFSLVLVFTGNLSGSSPFSQTQFTPDLSLILDFSFHYHDSRDKIIGGMQPFQLAPLEDADLRSVRFNYLELAFSSVVDPYFDFFANIVLEGGQVEVEEAFVKTRFLPLGLSLKMGRFLSAFGRLNGQHEHQWSFDTAPLIYRQSFGAILNESGAQLHWVFPLDFYLMAGAEYLLGENENSFNRGSLPQDPGAGIVCAYIKSSFDFGNWVLLCGASLADGAHRWQEAQMGERDGRSTIWGLDLTVKYQLDSYAYLMLQGEYMGRNVGSAEPMVVDSRQQGGYVDLLYRSSPRWRFGLRLDWMRIAEPVHEALAHPLDLSAMVEFNPTEFSRIRFFYRLNRHQIWRDEGFSAHEFGLVFNLAVGAHGAHAF